MSQHDLPVPVGRDDHGAGPDDTAVIARVVDQLQAYERSVEDRLREATARADTAEERARALDRQLDEARRHADAVGAEQARRAAESERDAVRERERRVVEALRSYVTDVEQAQRALLDVARQALSTHIPDLRSGPGLPAAAPAPAAEQPDHAQGTPWEQAPSEQPQPEPGAPRPAEPAGGRPWGAPAAEGGDGRGGSERPAAAVHDLAPPNGAPVWPAPGPGGPAPHPWGPPDGAPVASHEDTVADPAEAHADPAGAVADAAAGPAAGRSDPTTDEHRLIDLRNQQDLQRIHTGRGWRRFGGSRSAGR